MSIKLTKETQDSRWSAYAQEPPPSPTAPLRGTWLMEGAAAWNSLGQ